MYVWQVNLILFAYFLMFVMPVVGAHASARGQGYIRYMSQYIESGRSLLFILNSASVWLKYSPGVVRSMEEILMGGPDSFPLYPY